MSWEEVDTKATDIKAHKDKPFIGTFKGHKDIETKIGPQKIWEFIGSDGLPLGIYGFTNLNRALECISLETKLRIMYRGTENVKTKYGMKDVHQVSVQIWRGEEDPPVDDSDAMPF